MKNTLNIILNFVGEFACIFKYLRIILLARFGAQRPVFLARKIDHTSKKQTSLKKGISMTGIFLMKAVRLFAAGSTDQRTTTAIQSTT